MADSTATHVSRGHDAIRTGRRLTPMAIQLGFQPEDFTMKTWRAVAAEFIATGLFVFLGTATVVVARAWLVETGSGTLVPSSGFVIAVALGHGLALVAL